MLLEDTKDTEIVVIISRKDGLLKIFFLIYHN